MSRTDRASGTQRLGACLSFHGIVVLTAALTAAMGCNALVGIEELRVEPEGSGSIRRLPRDRVDKVDLLFVLDDSTSMGPMQDTLAALIPDLVQHLINPPCVDPFTREELSRVGQGENCPNDMEREFPPLEDIQVGVI
ncbi:MAG: hypothetical protein ACOC1F_08270, partial [Myxococcota bacterium]